MPQVLIPYFHAGFGHVSFAAAIEQALRARAPAVDAQLVDLGAELRVDALERLYVGSWQRLLALPQVVQRALYALNAVFPWGFALANERAIRRALPAARAFLHRSSPDAIMSTHWGCCHLLDRARRAEGSGVPLYYIYTELAGAERPLRCGADIYFCLTEDAGEALVSVGVPRHIIRRVEPVVQPELCGSLPSPPEARRALGLREDCFTVLFSLGGEGIGKVFSFLDHFSLHGRHAQMLILTGRNADLLQRLKKRYPPRRDRALIAPVGYLASVQEAFASADILAGKCGTSFALEAIATGKLLLVTRVGAPNEASNRDYMVRQGHARDTRSPAAFTAAVEHFASAALSRRPAEKAPAAVAAAGGALGIADFILARLKERE